MFYIYPKSIYITLYKICITGDRMGLGEQMVTFRMSKEQYEKLKKVSAKYGYNISSFIRSAVLEKMRKIENE